MANKRIKDLPVVLSPVAGDTLAIDGATTRSITIEDFADWMIASAQTEQVITAGAVVNVAPNDGLIKLNKTISSVTQINLPLATTKVGPVTICDFKGDSDTYMVTIVVTGSDKLPGNLTQWIMSDAGQSITLKPLKDGTGYAVL